MVSHELLTPLVLLVGLSEMMLKEETVGQAFEPAAFHQDLMRMYTSAQHWAVLVRDVLDLTRSQVGELRLVRKPLDLNKTLEAVALVGEEMARTKGLAWQAEIPRKLPTVLEMRLAAADHAQPGDQCGQVHAARLCTPTGGRGRAERDRARQRFPDLAYPWRAGRPSSTSSASRNGRHRGYGGLASGWPSAAS